MKKRMIFGVGSAAATALASASLVGSGLAVAAPDVVGDTYSDAADAIENSGGTVVVASRVGDQLDQDDCIVVNASETNFLRIDSSGGQVSLTLNCNGAYATATDAGQSVQHPLGRQAKSEAEKQAADQEEQELAEVSTPDE